jgi:hypothetical protein
MLGEGRRINGNVGRHVHYRWHGATVSIRMASISRGKRPSITARFMGTKKSVKGS